MRELIASFATGLIFGVGLVVSMMTNPLKVLSFLDVAGAWDPSLLLVMATALVVTLAGYRRVLRRPAPALASAFRVPEARAIDARVLCGSAVFGVGWGLVGFCPGPAVAALGLMPASVAPFLAAVILGMVAAQEALARLERPPTAA